MDAKFSDLVDYFRQIASEHKSIQHTATNKHFFRFELDEVLSGIANNLKYPAMILEGYEVDYSESSSDNISRLRSGAFWIIGKVSDIKDFDRIHQVWDECEEIGNDILVRIRADKESRTVPAVRGFDISSCIAQPLSLAATGQHGMRFTFSIRSTVNSDKDSSKWL
jgi:hypothetical protein